MKHYKLIALSVGAKGNRPLFKKDNKTYPENTWDEGRAEELVGLGFLVRIKGDPIKATPKIKSEPKPEKEKPEAKKEPSILDSMKEAGGEETEEISEKDEKEALLKEAKELAENKGIKAPHYLTGIEKLKTFIDDNK
ncbi:hypothetical protein LCGC14_0593610 [marine sediment metagenome]|uniref:Uncharacterized protein n=1 Tax=marine sediment metagenome TaxID=412755 RepID=A0A0F9TYX8_9ZZZZ